MRIPKTLKLNKFQYVRIPSMGEEFRKHGFMAALPSNYTGNEIAPTAIRKSEMYAEADKFERKTVKEAAEKKPEK